MDTDECPYCNGFNTCDIKLFEIIDDIGYLSKACRDCFGEWDIEYKVVRINCTCPPIEDNMK